MSKKKAGSKKRRLNLAAARKKQKEMEERGGNEFHELKEGWNFFAILPPWDDDVDVLWKEVQQHGRLVCPEATVGKQCILCAEVRRRMKKGDTDFADEHRLRSRAFFNAIRKEHIKKKDPAGVKVLGVSSTVFEAILEQITDEEVDISDPKAAVIVAIKRKGKGIRTRYPKVKFSDPIDISKYITDDIMGALWDLDALRYAQPATTKELKKAIRGAADEDGDDEDFDDLSSDEGTETSGDDEFGEDDLSSDEDGGSEAEGEEDELLGEPEDGEDPDGEEDPELEELMGDDEEPEEKPARRVRKASTKASGKKKVRRRAG